jgi:AAA domain-containing protein
MLYLIRGLPGSGKSTMARQLLESGKVDRHFEADMFHVDVYGVYRFNPENSKAAHAWCLDQTAISLASTRSVAVSNTFTTIPEIWPYVRLGYPTIVLTAYGKYGSIHNVPDSVIEAMSARWES